MGMATASRMAVVHVDNQDVQRSCSRDLVVSGCVVREGWWEVGGLGLGSGVRFVGRSAELDALRGIGVGFGRLLRVPYFYALGLMLLNIVIVGWVEPYSRYRYEGLRFDLRSGALGASIKVGEFNNLGKRLTLRIDRSDDASAFECSRRVVRDHAARAHADDGDTRPRTVANRRWERHGSLTSLCMPPIMHAVIEFVISWRKSSMRKH